MREETIAIHAGNLVRDANKPAIQGITTSTTFEHHEGSMVYSRTNNPNRMALEQLLSKLEKGDDAAAFSSGNAAAMTVFQSLAPGSHILAPDDMYHGIKNQLLEMFKGIHEISFVDMSNLDQVGDSIKANTALIWVETPSNPLLKITDIRGIVGLGRSGDLKVVCDNTFATPIFQNPLSLGADLVMHSTTKFLGGHSDILGGALVTAKKDAFWENIKRNQSLGGAVPSPFDCYFLVRSIKTLPYRMRAHQSNALALQEFLAAHPQVEQVFYPGYKAHEGYALAKTQMKGFSGVLSFMVKGNAQTADDLIANLHYFTHATSLGGVESLIERRAAVEGPDTSTPPNLIRVSVGLENIEDLIEDLQQAFESLSTGQ